MCPLAPSRGGVLQLRGNPVHGTNPRRPVFILRPCPCERAPPGLALGVLGLSRSSPCNPIPIIRPAGCASELPGPGCEVTDCTPSAPSSYRAWGHKEASVPFFVSFPSLSRAPRQRRSAARHCARRGRTRTDSRRFSLSHRSSDVTAHRTGSDWRDWTPVSH